MMKKQKCNIEDNRGEPSTPENPASPTRATVSACSSSNVQNTPNGNCTLMKNTLFLNMRIKDFPATIPTDPSSSVCFAILKWARFVPLFATN